MNANTQKLPPEGETSDRATADAGANTMWGGRFASGPAAVMERINASIGFDRRLYAQDIAGSKAHCTMLVHQRIIAQEDGRPEEHTSELQSLLRISYAVSGLKNKKQQ